MTEKQKIVKKRSGNYSTEEEFIFATLVNEKRDIIECKKQVGATWQEKQKAWQEIADSFNAKHGKNFRDVESLRNKWSQMKKTTKKKASENKKESLKTGGGNPIIQSYNDVDNIIMGILGEQIHGLNNNEIFDSDAQDLTTHTALRNVETNDNIEMPLYKIDKSVVVECEEGIYNNILCEPINVKLILPAPNSEKDDSGQTLNCLTNANFEDSNVGTENVVPNEVEAGSSQDWSHYSTKMLKGRRHNKLVRNRPVNAQRLAAKTAPKINEILAQTKLDFVLLQKEKFLEEHNLRMQNLQKQLEYEEKRSRENNIT